MAIARPTRPWLSHPGRLRQARAASRVYKIWAVFRAGEVEGNIDGHILLAADELLAGFEKDGPGVDAVLQCCGFSVAQETRVHAGIAERKGVPVDVRGRSCSGQTRSSAASWRANRSQPRCQPSSEATAMNGSMGQFLAPAPWPASDASTRVAPSTTLLATASDRFWWAWMPSSVAGPGRPGRRGSGPGCRPW